MSILTQIQGTLRDSMPNFLDIIAEENHDDGALLSVVFNNFKNKVYLIALDVQSAVSHASNAFSILIDCDLERYFRKPKTIPCITMNPARVYEEVPLSGSFTTSSLLEQDVDIIET
jgi:hypothetical protein